MTVVLVAVYVPVGFQSGLTGALFTEFAFTLAGAVAISGVVALTLSPMMCSRMLKPPQEQRGWQARFAAFVDRRFEVLHGAYQRALHGSLNTLPVTAIQAIVLSSIYFLYTTVAATGAGGGPGSSRKLHARPCHVAAS
jgi:multidrug efflux pump